MVVEHCALAQHEPTIQERKGKRAGTAVHADCDAESSDPERDEVRRAGYVRRRDGNGKTKVEVKAWHEHRSAVQPVHMQAHDVHQHQRTEGGAERT
mgnify:CR=1 FL=1